MNKELIVVSSFLKNVSFLYGAYDTNFEKNMTETERLLSSIIKDVLDLSILDKKMPLYTLGASSLSMMDILSNIHEQFSIELTPHELLAQDTLSSLARYLDKKQNDFLTNFDQDILTSVSTLHTERVLVT